MCKSREDILTLMLSGKYRLSRYDEKFITDIFMVIDKKKMITSNQSLLFEKIARKYNRQFEKQKVDIEQLLTLPWKTQVVESAPEYIGAFISIENNTIFIKCPYNRKVIDSLCGYENDGSDFTWDKKARRYEAPFTTNRLRAGVKVVTKNYDLVNFCPVTTELLNKAKLYEDVLYWAPTLIKVNDRFLIAASNEFLDNAIKDITLNDDPKTLFTLSAHGVKIHDSILNTSFKRFAGTGVVFVEVDDLFNIIQWMKDLDIDGIEPRNYRLTNRPMNVRIRVVDFCKECESQGIPVITSPAQAKNPVLLRSLITITLNQDVQSYSKIVVIVNSNPVEVK